MDFCRCPDPAVRHQLVTILRDPSLRMVDARGNTGTHDFILVPAAGLYVQQMFASALYYLAPGVPIIGGTSEATEGGNLPSLC